ncbi:MAG: hypothetical protein E2598_10510 [Sphingobium sp.]|nr:hypothetical protein [Sphingobium sp.]
MANITSHPADIVDNDNQPELPVLADIGEHIVEAGTLSEATRHVIREYGSYLMAPVLAIFTASCFLR